MTAPPMDTPMDEQMDPALTGQVLQETIQELFGPEAQSPGQSDPSKANDIAGPNPPEDDVEPIERATTLMAALYGSDFPLIDALNMITGQDPEVERIGQIPPLATLLAQTTNDAWAKWVRGRWQLHGPAVELHLYLVARNRLFRNGQQWVSSRGREPWREPNRPTDQARVTHNIIAPALDQRIQIITENRPGFQVLPDSLSPDAKRKAEGRQQALEHQYDSQAMDRQTAEAAYWAQTDGVAFWHTYWDREAGPWDERMGDGEGSRKPLGDLRTETLRVEQVRVSANATATDKPYYVILRKVISSTEAAYLYGAAGVQDQATSGDLAGNGDNDSSGTGGDSTIPSGVLQQTIVGEGNRLNNIKTVEQYTMYVDKHPDVLPDGLQIVVVGNAIVWGPGELLFGTIPVIPVRDGSTDPSYYPRPIMEQWIPPCQRINAALSLWVNSVRVNSGGRFVTKPDAISRETFVGSGLSLLEVDGPGIISDNILPIQGFSVGQDVQNLIAFDVKAFEDMSGYNDVSRGQVSGETATAVATANEQLERVFAPVVTALADSFEDWAKVNIAGMAWGYDVPRDVGAVGSDRPDLARALQASDFDGPCTVKVEGERLIPMPKVYRLQILDNWLDRGIITSQQYMRNVKFANFKNLDTPDEDQQARAKRVADAIRLGKPLPPPPNPMDPMSAQAAFQPLALRWQTNEAIEQDVLEREILLQDDLDPQIIAVADMRWKALAQQAAIKSGALAPPPPAPSENQQGPSDQSGPSAVQDMQNPAGPEGQSPSPVSPPAPGQSATPQSPIGPMTPQ